MTEGTGAGQPAPQPRCGDRVRDGSFEWVCNRPVGHPGRHEYRTPGGDSRVYWEKVEK